jgi:hypothetical protein
LNATTRFALAGFLGATLLCGAPRGLRAEEPTAPTTPSRSKNAWTLDEALRELKLNPRDTYLQYLVLQLARRAEKLEAVAGEVERLAFGGDADGRQARTAQVDLFGMFAGALAVQEGLQLDTMRGRLTLTAGGSSSGPAAGEAAPPPPPPPGEALAPPATSTPLTDAAPAPQPIAVPSPSDAGEPPPMPPADPIPQSEKKPRSGLLPLFQTSVPAAELPSGNYLPHEPQYIRPTQEDPQCDEEDVMEELTRQPAWAVPAQVPETKPRKVPYRAEEQVPTSHRRPPVPVTLTPTSEHGQTSANGAPFAEVSSLDLSVSSQAASITGQVLDDETCEPILASVRCVLLEKGTGRHHSLQMTTDADGTFVLTGLEAGKSYRVTATANKCGRVFAGTHRVIAPNICATIRLTDQHRHAKPIPVIPTSEPASPSPKSTESSQTLPTGWYFHHTPQYIPPSPAYPLPRELENLQDASAKPGEAPTSPSTAPPAKKTRKVYCARTAYKDVATTVIGQDGTPMTVIKKVPYTYGCVVSEEAEEPADSQDASTKPTAEPAKSTEQSRKATSTTRRTVTQYKPVSETYWKVVTETVVGKDGKPEVRTRKVPYTVQRIVAVTSEVEVVSPPAPSAPPAIPTPAAPPSPAPSPYSPANPGGPPLPQSWQAVPAPPPPPAPEPAPPAKDEEKGKWEQIRGPLVKVSGLHGPKVKSHPWHKMLASRDPKVSDLSRCVPHDFYLVEFRSVSKFLELIESADQWSTFIYSQSVKDARSQHVSERVRKQLALETNFVLQPFYDRFLIGMAITGSDLFIREGSDVTLLLHFRQNSFDGHTTESIFRHGMSGMLARAEKAHPDATRTSGKMLGVDYVHVATPDRAVCVYAAYPKPGLHVRTNSKAALQRVLEAIRGTDTAGKRVKRLGETDEFKYIRTLMPQGATEEDGFVYLSDAFIRHMVSPQLKLTELRRLMAYNHLRMIGHAAQMYRTEQGKFPASLEALASADCCPGKFNEGDLRAPDGGFYTLSDDGTSGLCARHGTARFMTPCCEIPVARVTTEEAAAYKAFVDQYNQYWRTYFDPIAIRVQVQPKRVRMETIVLPLIDNTVYTMLSKFLGGEPEHLDQLPVPKRNIFSLNVRLNKEELLKEIFGDDKSAEKAAVEETSVLAGFFTPAEEYVVPPPKAMLTQPPDLALAQLMEQLSELVRKGVGNQVGLHVYDQGVPFDLNLATFLGQMLGSFNGNGTSGSGLEANLGVMAIAVPVAACTAPGYISFTVKDAKVVDSFLTHLDKAIPTLTSEFKGQVGLPIEGDYYKLTLKGGVTARSFALRVGPARFRVHCARIGKGFYITNHASVLEDLHEAAMPAVTTQWDWECMGVRPLFGHQGNRDLGPKAHALVRMRPRNWDQALPGFRLSWAENNRQTCLCNQGPLSGIARALSAVPPGEGAKTASWDDRCILDHAARVYGTYHACPDGGRYVLSADGKSVVCTVHGSPQDPRQTAAPADSSPTARLMRDFADLTAALTFTPEGLRAVLTIERK